MITRNRVDDSAGTLRDFIDDHTDELPPYDVTWPMWAQMPVAEATHDHPRSTWTVEHLRAVLRDRAPGIHL